MLKWGSRGQFIARLIVSILLLPSVSAVEGRSKKPKEVPHGTPILWRAPQENNSRKFFFGAGGERMKPDFCPVEFFKKWKGGCLEKFCILSCAGRGGGGKRGK